MRTDNSTKSKNSGQFYDVAIIGAWASGIFASIHIPENLNIILLEKTGKIASKVLLSWGERCNVSNMYIDKETDFCGKNKKVLHSLFHSFSQYDMLDWLEKQWIQVQEEENGRLLLKSGDACELVYMFEKKLQKKNITLKKNFPVISLEKKDDIFFITWESMNLRVKKVVIATGGKSFAQVGTDGYGYSLAKKFWIKIIPPYKWLTGINTQEDLSVLAGIKVEKLRLKVSAQWKIISEETGSILFTHFWISGPIVFNTSLKLWEYARKNGVEQDENIFLKENIELWVDFSKKEIPKKCKSFFNISQENTQIKLLFNDFRSWKEAKVSGGWVALDELSKNFESKKLPWLYFIGEVVDLTGKTGGYNLQLAWSMGYHLAKNIV